MKAHVHKWPRIYSRTNKGGTVSFLVDLGLNQDGKRDRRFFKTKAEADGFAEAARLKRENDGIAIFQLPREFWIEAQRASELLAPYSASMLDAARYYVDHLGKFKSAPTIADATKELLAEMNANNRRERTVQDVQNRLGKFAVEFGKRRLSELTVPEIKNWLNQWNWSARSKSHYLTKISQLFNFGLRHGYAEKNVVDCIKRPSVEQTETGILTVEQAARLLKHAKDFGLLPYVAIGLFGGLRNAELLRLDASAVNFADGVVTVGASVAKKRAMRHVTMNDALRAWLELCRPLYAGPIVRDINFRKNFTALRKAAGIEDWPHNALRHTFGSIHFAAYGDAKKTAQEMGNTEEMVHKHYKALMLKAEAERFWALRPQPVIPLPVLSAQSDAIAA